MFLYELAIELGEHSNDLVAVATMLGIVDAGPATKLDAQQVAQLRAHFGGAATGPPPPPAGAAGPTAGSGPVAPPTWGPPGTPTFQAAPGPPMGTPPPPPPPGPLVDPRAVPERRWSTGQLAALVGVVVVVLGLFGFMVVNTGPDEERQQALDAREEELAAATTEWVPPPEVSTTTEAPPVTAAPMPRARPGGLSGGGSNAPDPVDKPPAPVDQTRFCSGARGVLALEEEGMAAIEGDDIEAEKRSVTENVDAWRVGIEHMLAGASDRDRPVVEAYRDMYEAMFVVIERASSVLEVSVWLDANYTVADIDAINTLNHTAAAYCT